ncbi:MAG TPA: methyltransferase [Bryobacteraceae bacterium]|nr:methyltransferase [Bryobacteraceae bacterium]
MFPKPYADFVQRLRVPAGFLLLITFGWLSQPTLDSLVTGLPVAIVGLLLRGWAAGHLAKNQRLAMSGPYARMRNPLYAGTLTAALGIVIAARNVWLGLLFAFVFLLVYLPAIELEEQHLRTIFREYAPYAERVHRFLPIAKWPGRPGVFAWSLYRRNEEYKAAIGFAIAVAWLGWRCWLSLSNGR